MVIGLNSSPGSHSTGLGTVVFFGPSEPSSLCHAKHSPTNALTANADDRTLQQQSPCLDNARQLEQAVLASQFLHATIAANVPLCNSALVSV